MKDLFKKISIVTSFVLGALFIITGTYNTVMINSIDFMNKSEVSFAKRLDEIGNNKKARRVANIVTEKKAVKKITSKKKTKKTVKKKNRQIVEVEDEADELRQADLPLFEFYNGTLFKKPLTVRDFSGNLYIRGNMLENLEVNLPNNISISVAYRELQNGTFTYEIDGEEYTGMLYEAGTNTYMVNLSNGPFQGTRMKFMNAPARNVAQLQDNSLEEIEQRNTVESDERADIGYQDQLDEQEYLAQEHEVRVEGDYVEPRELAGEEYSYERDSERAIQAEQSFDFKQ